MSKIKTWHQFLNESKTASNDSPIGYYTIANALMPNKFFEKLDELNINYTHDKYANFIEIFVNNIDEATLVRNLAISDIFEAKDIDDSMLPYIIDDGPGDIMEIKLKT